jgi:ADP-ribosyl-[dinitrogen reductase] hydrolase
MLGAIIGDIAGSRFEFNNTHSKNFDLFAKDCNITDDSIMTIAVAKAILACNGDWEQLENNAVKHMQEIGRKYPDCGFGGMFREWVFSDKPAPYKSYGNGAAMRVSPCGFIAQTEEEAILLSRKVTKITHNHPEGLKGAEAVSVAIFMARNGSTKSEIKERIEKDYYTLNFTLDSIRDDYQFDETCQGTVPQAIMAFLESVTFEDAIRGAVSIGGDSDTLAAISGSVAEAYYGVPFNIKSKAQTYLNRELLNIFREWEKFIRKTQSVKKFISLTKYMGKLEKEDHFLQFNIEFYNFLQSHPEYELGDYEDILEENGLRWQTDSMRSADENSLDEQCVLALITGAFRADHFSGGVLNEFVKDGYIDKWLGRLKALDGERKPEENKPTLKNVKIRLFPFQKETVAELLITETEIVIKNNTHDGGNVTHQYEYGGSSEIGELCLIVMRNCLEAEGWNDEKSFNEAELSAYLYELEAEYEDGNTVSHHGLFNRTHIPEKAFKAFIDTIHIATNIYGFGEILNLDGFMSAIKSGEVKYCGVEFSDGGSIYHYRTTDLRINVGDTVIVPVGQENHEREATVKTVDYCRWDDTPYPLEKTKQILRLAGDKSDKTQLLFSAKKPLLCSPDLTIIDYNDEEN